MAKRFYIEQYSAAESNAKYVVEIHDPLHGQSVNFGLLYNYFAINDIRLIAADGWYVPNTSEWETLSTYLGGNSVSAKKLKEIGTTHWGSYSEDVATNEVDFSAIGGGSRTGGAFNDGSFLNLLYYGEYWRKDYGCMVMFDTTGVLYPSARNMQWGASVKLFRPATESELLLPDGLISTKYTGNDLKEYDCTKIGTQVWIVGNLCETKYRNGDWITGFDGGVYTPFTNAEWTALTTEALCAFDNDFSIAYFNGAATLLDGSFMLRYDEGKVSDLLFPLLASVAEITVNVTEADTLFEDFIDELTLRNEDDLLVKIFREEDQIWMGQIPTDLVDYPDEYYTYQVTISAVCGLARLKNIKYDDAGTPFEGRNTILGHFLNCLTKLNYNNESFGYSPLLRVIGFMWEEDNMLLSEDSHLENIDLAYDCFQQYDYFNKIESMSCYAVLEQLCRNFNFRLFMCGNAFCLQQIQEGNNADAYTYTANGTLVDAEVLDVTRSFSTERTNGRYSNYPPVRDISLIYNYKQGINRGNLLPAGYTLGELVNVGELTGGAGEIMMIKISGSMLVSNVDFVQWYARYSVLLRIGDKWLTGYQDHTGAVSVSWSDTLATFTYETLPVGSTGYYPFATNIYTPEIPASGTGYFEVEYAGIFITGGPPIPPTGNTASATFISAALSQIVETVDESSGRVKFTATNTTDGTTPISSNVSEELPDTLIGDGQRIYSAGRLRVYHGSDVWSNSDAWAAYNGGTAMNINKLRLQETLCIKKSRIKTFDFTLQKFAWMYEALMFNSENKLFVLGYELDPELDSVNVQTVFVNFDRTNILINSELDAPDDAGGSTGGGGGSSADTHNRLHDVVSTLDHAPAVGSDKGKLLGNNESTGVMEWVEKPWGTAIADGTYTVGIGTTTNGTITVTSGIITAITEAT